MPRVEAAVVSASARWIKFTVCLSQQTDGPFLQFIDYAWFDFYHGRKNFVMRKNLSIAFTFLALIGVTTMLAACHTTAGVGEDVSATGHAVTHEANKLTP